MNSLNTKHIKLTNEEVNLISGKTTKQELCKLGEQLHIEKTEQEKEKLYNKKLETLMNKVNELNIRRYLESLSIMDNNEIRVELGKLLEQNCLAFKKIRFLESKILNLNNEIKLLTDNISDHNDNETSLSDELNEVENKNLVLISNNTNLTEKNSHLLDRITNLRSKCIYKNKKIFFHNILLFCLFMFNIIYLLYTNNYISNINYYSCDDIFTFFISINDYLFN